MEPLRGRQVRAAGAAHPPCDAAGTRTELARPRDHVSLDQYPPSPTPSSQGQGQGSYTRQCLQQAGILHLSCLPCLPRSVSSKCVTTPQSQTQSLLYDLVTVTLYQDPPLLPCSPSAPLPALSFCHSGGMSKPFGFERD